MESHAINHGTPSKPVAMNAQRQPNCSVIHGTMSGARIAPILLPALKMPVAKDLSFCGNHSAVVLIAAGKLPDSPRPSTNRAIAKPNTVATSEWPIAARLQMENMMA